MNNPELLCIVQNYVGLNCLEEAASIVETAAEGNRVAEMIVERALRCFRIEKPYSRPMVAGF